MKNEKLDKIRKDLIGNRDYFIEGLKYRNKLFVYDNAIYKYVNYNPVHQVYIFEKRLYHSFNDVIYSALSEIEIDAMLEI